MHNKQLIGHKDTNKTCKCYVITQHNTVTLPFVNPEVIKAEHVAERHIVDPLQNNEQ